MGGARKQTKSGSTTTQDEDEFAAISNFSYGDLVADDLEEDKMQMTERSGPQVATSETQIEAQLEAMMEAESDSDFGFDEEDSDDAAGPGDTVSSAFASAAEFQDMIIEAAQARDDELKWTATRNKPRPANKGKGGGKSSKGKGKGGKGKGGKGGKGKGGSRSKSKSKVTKR